MAYHANNMKCSKIPQAIYPPHPRIVAIGDVHGDWAGLIQSLEKAKIIKYQTNKRKYMWIGGNTIVIQVGDILDRACRANWCPVEKESQELRILKFLYDLNIQAEKKGGQVLVLLGNHEIMNIMGDFRYVDQSTAKNLWDRKQMFQPGSVWARHLACNTNSLIKVGSWVFSHAGVLPEISYKYSIPDINEIIRNFLLGHDIRNNNTLFDKNPELLDFFWHRDYAPHMHNRCTRLDRSLKKLGAKRMVVGHSPQTNGITNDCGENLWRIDIGMSEAFGPRNSQSVAKRIQVLEIINDGETINIL